MKKYFFVILLLLPGYLLLSGQSPVPEVQLKALEEKTLKGSWDFSVGTSYSYMKGYGSGMEFHAAPVYTLPLNDRWSLHGGILASHYTGLNTPVLIDQTYPNTGASLAVFGAASYRMSERLVLHGSGVKNLVSGPVSPLSSYTMDQITVGASYKLGDNISIGASVRMIQGQDYYQGSPFRNTAMPGSPFLSPYGW